MLTGRQLLQILPLLLGHLLENAPSYHPRELAGTAHSLARLGISPPEVLDAIATQAEARAITIGPREASTLLWAFASMGSASSGPVQTMLKAVGKQMSHVALRAKPLELSNAIWALAKAEAGDENVYCRSDRAGRFFFDGLRAAEEEGTGRRMRFSDAGLGGVRKAGRGGGGILARGRSFDAAVAVLQA